MRIRIALLIGMVALLAAGCGVTKTVTGQASPIVSARITIHPAPGAALTKPDTDATIAVIEKRLATLGVHNYSLSAGNDITVELADSGDVSAVQFAMQTAGVVTFVPLDLSADTPPVGSFPNTTIPPLWAGNEIAAAAIGRDQNGLRTLDITLTPTSAQVFGTWTVAHLEQTVLVLMDGRVLLAPVITAPILGGEISITNAGGFPASIEAMAAVIDSGPLTLASRQP